MQGRTVDNPRSKFRENTKPNQTKPNQTKPKLKRTKNNADHKQGVCAAVSTDSDTFRNVAVWFVTSLHSLCWYRILAVSIAAICSYVQGK